MIRTFVRRVLALAITVALGCTAPAFAAGNGVAQQKWQTLRTADGHPDLQDTWTNATITPLERPDKYGDKLVLSEAEARELEQAEAAFNETANAPTDPDTKAEDLPANCGRGFSGANCGYGRGSCGVHAAVERRGCNECDQ